MSKVDVVIEVLLEFLSPTTAIGSTEYDDKAYRNLKDICYVHDYCYDLIKDNVELIGNEYSVERSKEYAIKHLKESIENMTDLLKDLEGIAVLDEIKADIEQTTSRYCLSIEHSALGHVVWSDRLIKESEVLEIIDKYKAEGSENSEND